MYLAGVFAPKKDLPSARLISEKLIRDVDRTRPDITLMFMVFGQFVSHDLNLAPVFVLRKFPSPFILLYIKFDYFLKCEI